jgi:hypothetical protein
LNSIRPHIYIASQILLLVCIACESGAPRTASSAPAQFTTADSYEQPQSEIEDSPGDPIEDGTYTATVDYYNPNTGWENTYDLDVEVSDRMLVRIDFANGGWIDAYEELDDEGNATVVTDDGREFRVHVEP